MTFNFQSKEREVVDLSPLLQENPSIDTISQCAVCPLNDEHPLSVQGNGKLRMLIVLSHPTKGDMQTGRLSTSHAYMRLAQDLRALNIDIDEDCWVTTAVRCFPHANVPSKKMYDCCRGRLLNTVQRLKPTTILLAGRNAVHGWIGHQFTVPPRQPDHFSSYHDTDYDMWVGHIIPDHEYAFEVDGKQVCPAVIPLFNIHDVTKLEQKNMGRQIMSIVPKRHTAIMMMAVDYARTHAVAGTKAYLPYDLNVGQHVEKVRDVKKAITILQQLNTKPIIAFDYETTGLKPYDVGHRIVMVGISDGTTSYAIPFFDYDEDFVQAYKTLMTNKRVKKICHNFKYEYNWTRKILGYEIENVYWDTMLVAHILDMRDGITGLKVQGYLKFGISGYEKVTKKLLIANDKKTHGSNGKNALQYLEPRYLTENHRVWDLLLLYVAKDAALTYALYMKQRSELVDSDYKHLKKGIDLFMESSMTLAEMEYNGFVFDSEQCAKNKDDIKQRMEELQQLMKDTDEYSKWRKVHPDKELNTNSPKQLQEFLYSILQYDVPKLSKSGNPSTDKDSLEQINSEFTRYMLEYKALDKMLNSFLTGYEAEANDDGHLRCFFNMNNVKSYRTSSSNVNLQNVSHHSEISKYALNLMKPHKGHVMLNADFRALEVFGAACYTHDNNLITYLSDEKTDMHRDVACDIHFYKPEDLPKRLRSVAKAFTFAAFYGSGYKSIAHNQWKNLLPEDKERLKQYDIKNFDDFEGHIKEMFDRFWFVRFRKYAAWRRKQWNFYTKYGYVVGHTGFLYTGVMNARQVSNFPIQGPSAHILLRLSNHVRKFIKENGFESKPLAEVHDSLMLSCPEHEVPPIYHCIHEFLKGLPVSEPWTSGLNFEVEVEKSAVDGNWGEVKPDVKITGREIIQLEK